MFKSAQSKKLAGDYVATILLADDSTHAQRMGAKILAAEGIEVIAVSNGDAAVKKLHEIAVDLVLADVYMPGLDGYEVCERIKSSPDHPGLPVVLLVGALEPFEPDRIAQVRADGVLRKPFEASAVLEVVKPLLENYAAAHPKKAPAAAVEQTVVIPPPPPPAEPSHSDTVEMKAPVFDTAPAPAPEPPPAPVADVEMAVAPPEPPLMEVPVEAPSPAEMAVAMDLPPMEVPSASAESGTSDLSLPPVTEEYSAGEFTIPDVGGHVEGTADAAALSGALDASAETIAIPPPAADAASRWVAEQVPLSAEDHEHFSGEFPLPSAAVASSKESPKETKKESTKEVAPPDWGELLKSVEDHAGPAGSVIAVAGAAAVAAVAASHSGGHAAAAAPAHHAEKPATANDLELEIPAEEAAAPPAPAPGAAINEEELRMAVHLCLESALPGLADEITAAVLRRLKPQG